MSILSLLGLVGLLIFDSGPLAPGARRKRIKTDVTYAEGVLYPTGPSISPRTPKCV